MELKGKPSGKLNFNTPLLSTRRPCTCSYLEDHATSHPDRVPFSWEQAPGKPKDSRTACIISSEEAAFTPRPKPPPARWRPPTNKQDEDDEISTGKDILSLTEAIDIVEKEDHRQVDQEEASSSDTPSSNLDRLTSTNSTVGEVNAGADARAGTLSPNFIMERFLPDAAALAAATSAALNLSKGLNHNRLYPETRPPAESVSSTRACGLEMVLPWRMRRRLAGVNSLVHHHPRRSNAKHKRTFSSLHLPSADWSCK